MVSGYGVRLKILPGTRDGLTDAGLEVTLIEGVERSGPGMGWMGEESVAARSEGDLPILGRGVRAGLDQVSDLDISRPGKRMFEARASLPPDRYANSRSCKICFPTRLRSAASLRLGRKRKYVHTYLHEGWIRLLHDRALSGSA